MYLQTTILKQVKRTDLSLKEWKSIQEKEKTMINGILFLFPKMISKRSPITVLKIGSLNRSVTPQCFTRHISADSVPTSNLFCIKEVAIRTTFSHMIDIAEIIYHTCSLVIDIECSRYKNAFNKRFFLSNELCVKITAKIYFEKF